MSYPHGNGEDKLDYLVNNHPQNNYTNNNSNDHLNQREEGEDLYSTNGEYNPNDNNHNPNNDNNDTAVHLTVLPSNVGEDAESTYIHPSAAKLFEFLPFVKHIPLFGTVCTVFGPAFTLSLGFGYLLSKGAAGNIINVSRQPMFINNYGVTALEYQRLASMYSLGWSVKAFVAVFADLFPIFGYTKRWYLAASALLGSVFALAYALLPKQRSSANAAAGFVFLTCFCKANVDILTEGHYSRLMRRFPGAGPSVVSWVWAMTFAGTVVSACMMGPLADAGLTYAGVIVSAGLQFITTFFFVFNLYGEKKNKTERRKDALLAHRMRIQELEREHQEALERQREEHLTQENERGEGENVNSDEDNNNNNNLAEKDHVAVMGEQEGVVEATTEVEPTNEHEQQNKDNHNHNDNNHLSDELTLVPLLQQQQQQTSSSSPREEHHYHEGDNMHTNRDDPNSFVSTKNWEEIEPFVEPKIYTCCCGAAEFNSFVLYKNWKLVLFSVVMACAVVTLAVVTVSSTVWGRLYTVIVIAVVMCVGAFLCLPLVVAKAALFMFLSSALYIQIPGALSNFYLAGPKCIEDGPHFSYTFYSTIAALITNAAGVLGSVLFTRFFSKHKFIWVFVATTLLQMAGSIFDLIIVKRWNISIGIPDHAMYILGDAIVYEVCFVLSIMPQQILMSRLCPRGTESMSFALLAGISTIGNSLSVVIGSLLMELAWPVSNTIGKCNFDNLPYLIITGHLSLPVLTVPLAFFLLPNARICDVIDHAGRVVKSGLQKRKTKVN